MWSYSQSSSIHRNHILVFLQLVVTTPDLKPDSTRCPNANPQGFSTRDGHIVVAAGNTQFIRVCEVLQLKELAEDPKYTTNKLRVQHRKELLHTLSHRFLQETTADWLKQFEGSGVPVGPINNIQENQSLESGSDPEPESGSDPEPESGSDLEPESGSDPEPESGSDLEPESGSDPEPESGSDPEPESGVWK
ncbi:Succinate--hydroxymethylglutarate CoA-transferase [Dissostichus eleginoides]|uniref:Succinate--hydroxymethylglutarate CoA-transferase n=1 Tax=Dissostichus eleginoides TaxID=100907 RepID=A0AAD9B158_DISEL|nr:Succinate--hydroxymethylglutarate CoA-transferase [Dissostichus eleginoides]